MSFGGIEYFERSPEIANEIAKEGAKKELNRLGLEASRENIEAVRDQQETKQHPAGYEKILANLGNPVKLKKAMEEEGIKSIVHSEGLTVWGHAKKAIQTVETMNLPDEEKADLKLIMLYHDLGKTTAAKSEKNVARTEKNLKKGDLHQAMIGHPRERLDDIRAGFTASGVTGQKLENFMTVVKNHMNTSLMEQDPKKTVKLFKEFGANDEQRMSVVKLLVAAIRIDGQATGRAALVHGKIEFSENEKKVKSNFTDVWDRYKEGQKQIEKEEEKKRKKEQQAALEQEIFGKKLTDYLIKDRDVTPGAEMGKAIGKIRVLIIKQKDLSAEKIKKLIDETKL